MGELDHIRMQSISMDLLISIFVAFLILICILPIGIIVQRLVMCAFKCLEKELMFGVFLENEF